MRRSRLDNLRAKTRAARLGTCITTLFALLTFGFAPQAHAYPQDHWTVQGNEKLEILRDYVCFNHGFGGERTETKAVQLSGNVVSAEVFLSGFNITGSNEDIEVAQIRVDAWVKNVGAKTGESGKNWVHVDVMYSLKDEDPTSPSEDLNKACVGFTVIAKTI